MGVLGKVGARLEKFDQGVEAARDSLTTQAVLNVALTAGVCIAVLLAIVALGRSAHD